MQPSEVDSQLALPLFRGLGVARLRRQACTALRARKEVYAWMRAGRPVPPPHAVKQLTLRAYASRFGLKVLVETGTYLGDMVAAMEPDFDRIYSIELGADLHQRAVDRFRGCENVVLIHGDSGAELGQLLPQLAQPALFWLDGHYSAGATARGSKDTPIVDELGHILRSGDMGHVVIVDDAREFGADPAYPSIAELIHAVREHWPAAQIAIKDDSIRICANRSW